MANNGRQVSSIFIRRAHPQSVGCARVPDACSGPRRLMKMGPTASNGLPAPPRAREVEGAKERSAESQYGKSTRPGREATATRLRPRSSSIRQGRTRRGLRQTRAGANDRAAQRPAAGLFTSSWRRAVGGLVRPPCRDSTTPVWRRVLRRHRPQVGLLCNLGYGDPAALTPRGPGFAFDELAKILRVGHERIAIDSCLGACRWPVAGATPAGSRDVRAARSAALATPSGSCR